MRHFLKKLLFVFLLFTAFLFVAEFFIGRELKKGKRYYFQADWHDLKDHNSSILFVGNSRIWVQVNPFVIEKYTGQKTELISQNGQEVQLHWLKFKEYIKHNKKPKHVFLEYDPLFIINGKDLYGLENFSTCFFTDRINLSSLSAYKGYHNYYRYLPLAAIDPDLMARILFSNTIASNEHYEKTHGYLGRKSHWQGDWHPQKFTMELKSSYVDSFFVYCSKHEIQLHAIYPPQSFPSYKNITNLNYLYKTLDDLNKKYHTSVMLHNYNSEKLYNDSSLFYNHTHLNTTGVAVFMKQLLQDSSIKW